MYAPSAANQQSAIFIVVQDKDTLKEIDALNAEIMGRDDVHPFYGALTVILVLAEKGKFAPVEDASLSLGNMFNAAASLGLGCCWVHRIRQMFESEKGMELLKKWGIEGDYTGVGSCALGYPNCPKPEAAPRKEGYIHFVK
jgi:nitroreductase